MNSGSRPDLPLPHEGCLPSRTRNLQLFLRRHFSRTGKSSWAGSTKSGWVRQKPGEEAGQVPTIGGSDYPPFVSADHPAAHTPIFALDVFDMEVPLPRVLMENVRDVVSDPAEWARMNVKKYGAD